MYARMMILEIDAAKKDKAQGVAAIRHAQEAIAPKVKLHKGCRHLYLLRELQTGKHIMLTLWDSEADMQASEASGFYAEQAAQVGSMLGVQPKRETFEVVFDL